MKIRKTFGKLMQGIMAAAALTVSAFTLNAAAAPAPTAQLTEANVISLMEEYDSESAYILKNSRDSKSFLRWWTGSKSLLNDLDTAVHEEVHSITHAYAVSGKYEAIYVGNGQVIQVPYTDVYPSKEMASTVPSSLRTFRFNTYVGNPQKNMASNVKGAYGLLNEFTAYYWGMRSAIELFPYYQEQAKNDVKVWYQYVSDGGNGCVAYAEFQYYTLRYMLYAKQNYPKQYQEMMQNQNFVTAYQQISKMYQELIVRYENSIPQIVNQIAGLGHKASYKNGLLYIDLSGRGGGKYSEFKALTEELNSASYNEIKNTMHVQINLNAIVNAKYTGTAAANNLKYAEISDSTRATQTAATTKAATTTIKIGNHQFVVTGANTAEYVRPLKKTETVSIPVSVSVNRQKYYVTSIAANAFKGNTTVKKITVPSKVTKIGANAFYGCKNLKTLNINGAGVTSKTVGKNAFKNMNKKAALNVPNAAAASYKQIFQARGLAKSASVK